MLFTAPSAGKRYGGLLPCRGRVVRSSDCAARPALLFCGVSCCGVCLVSSLILCYYKCNASNGTGMALEVILPDGFL